MIKTIKDLEVEYINFVKTCDERALDLSEWLPELGSRIRPVLPGELMIVMADTGQGKTAVLQNIAVKCNQANILMFEMELPGTACFERFAAISSGRTQLQIEEIYKGDQSVHTAPLVHISVCDSSNMSVEEMSETVRQARDDGNKPDVIMVDYIGLLSCKGSRSRYERVSQTAEQLKVFAKECDAVVIAATQIHRKSEDAAEYIGLHDAKDSGSIENSAQLVMGVWREGDKGEKMMLKILKSTRGGAGHDPIEASFDGSTLNIKSYNKAEAFIDVMDEQIV